MANLPFFKFDAGAWLTGKVQLLTPAEKGIFIDLVARIWYENGYLRHTEILHRQLHCDKQTLADALQVYQELDIMTEEDGVLSVKFVLEQIAEREDIVETRRRAGAKGGKQTQANKRIEEKRREKETPPDGGVKKEPPAPAAWYPGSVDEVLEIAEDPRCAVKISRQQAEAYFLARDTADWVDACGRKIAPGKVFGDLRRWALRDAAGAVRSAVAEETPEDRARERAERNRERAELEKAAEEWR